MILSWIVYQVVSHIIILFLALGITKIMDGGRSGRGRGHETRQTQPQGDD